MGLFKSKAEKELPVISVERMRKSDAYTIANSIPSVEAIKDILG